MSKSYIFIQNNEIKILVALCILSLMRLFVFGSAFPFFNNVDEDSHYDLVVKYAHGYLPDNNHNKFYNESLKYIGHYGSTEYLDKTQLPPGFKISPELESAHIQALAHSDNTEETSPPIYYATAGIWYNLGKYLGIQGGYLLYWIRFLNLPIYALLIAVSYFFCKFIDPDDTVLRLGVILILAFLPQDVFYSINNDVMSPLFFLISLFLLLKIYKTDCGFWLHIAAGSMVAATVLVKLTNLPVIIIYFSIILLLLMKYNSSKQIMRKIPNLCALLLSFAIPIMIWSAFNYYKFGDFTGTTYKINLLGWHRKQFQDFFNHPIFTPFGSIYFLSNLIISFWQGEIVWHADKIRSASLVIFYVFSSIIFYFSCVYYVFSKDVYTSSVKRVFYYIIICIPLLFAMYMALLSLSFDFGNCYYPSKDYPYITSGRLVIGSLVPFLIIYIKGIEYLISTIHNKYASIIIMIIMMYIGYSGVMLPYNVGVFESPFNLFHM